MGAKPDDSPTVTAGSHADSDSNSRAGATHANTDADAYSDPDSGSDYRTVRHILHSGISAHAGRHAGQESSLKSKPMQLLLVMLLASSIASPSRVQEWTPADGDVIGKITAVSIDNRVVITTDHHRRISVRPSRFWYSRQPPGGGYVSVQADLAHVRTAIRDCPEDCFIWVKASVLGTNPIGDTPILIDYLYVKKIYELKRDPRELP
jgi:hypothetical protein